MSGAAGSGNLAELVKEFKELSARRKAGEALPPAIEARRQELKRILRSAVESSATAADSAAVDEVSASAVVSPASRPPSMPPSPAAAQLPPMPAAPAPLPPMPAAPAPLPPMPAAPAPLPPMPAAPAASVWPAAPAPVIVPPPAPAPAAVIVPAAPSASASVARPAPAPTAPSAAPPRMPGAAPSPPLPSAPSTPAAAVAPPVRPAPAPTPPGAKPVAPRKDFFALDAAALLDAASKSEAVSKVDPFADRKAHASSEEVAAAEAKAEAALLANKKKERTRTPDEAAAQLKSTAAVYTPPEENLVLEQYYGDFVLDGYEPIDVRREQISLRPIDPREIELSKLADTNKSVSVGVPEGLAFLDDFPLLYIKKIVPPPSDEVVIDATDPNLLIPGKRKVTVHLLNGEKRQGAIRSLRRGDLGFKLEPLGSGQTEEMSISQVKAVFIHLQPNASPKDGTGRELTATFTDGRAVQGLSDDYQPGEPVFTLVPPAGRGQFERIIVNAAAVRSVV